MPLLLIAKDIARVVITGKSVSLVISTDLTSDWVIKFRKRI